MRPQNDGLNFWRALPVAIGVSLFAYGVLVGAVYLLRHGDLVTVLAVGLALGYLAGSAWLLKKHRQQNREPDMDDQED